MGRTKRQRSKKKLSASSKSSDREEEIISLLKWMRIQGNGWKSDLRLRNFSLSDGSTIRGLMTEKRLGDGDEIIRIPLNLIVDRKKAMKCVVKQLELKNVKWDMSGVSTHFLLVLFILIELRKGPGSYWLPYLKTLPLSFEMPHFCSQDEFELLPNYVKIPAQAKRREIDSCYNGLVEIFGNDFCSKDGFDWAWFAVNSRVIYHDAGDEYSNEDSIALAPYLDMLNHSPKARTVASVIKNEYQKISNGNGASYNSSDQVFIHYGHHSNTFLFVEYGFVLPTNDDDFFPLSLDDLASKNSVSNDILSSIKEAKLDKSLGIKSDGEVFGNVLAVLFIFINFKGNEDIWKAFEFEGSFLEDPKLEKTLQLVITSKLHEIQHLTLKCTEVKERTESFRVARNLLEMHHEILLNSFERYCFS